jgi:ParB family chromosome partitioning protein
VPRRSGLGRGLGALIPTEVANASGSILREIPLSQVRPNQFQPRTQFGEEALAALVDSIRAVGVLQPVLVRESVNGDYELIAGERRCRAARRAGLQTVPALVQEVSDASSLEQALVENIQREQLNPLDEAAAYQQLIEEFALTHDEVAKRVGRSRASVTNSLRLLQLPPAVQRLVRDERLSAGHARALLGTPDRELQERLATEAVVQGSSVRALESLVRESVRPPSLEGGEPFEEAELPGSGPSMDADGAPAAREEPTSLPPVAGGGVVSRPTPGLRAPGVLELEQLLADHLDTRVRVEMGAKHGKVVVEFATIEDLERIYRVMISGRNT